MKILDTKLDNISRPWDSFDKFVDNFYRKGIEELRQKMERTIQSEIEEYEKGLKGARQIRSKRYHTPAGTITIKRRAYHENGTLMCKADNCLNLPAESWLPKVEKLLSALGVSNEFIHAQELFTEWTNISISDHCLSNRVEKIGEELFNQEQIEPAEKLAPLDNILSCRSKKHQSKERVYVGVDGIMVPLRKDSKNKKSRYKEGKVGVIFWEKAHMAISLRRNEVRHKEYVATMTKREEFCELVFKKYSQVVQQKLAETIILGDGAKWIWDMAKTYFPESIEILDFYHVSEYVWKVAKIAWPEDEKRCKHWVRVQLKRLKKSQWKKVIQGLDSFEKPFPILKEAIDNLIRYLENNVERIDYKTYIEKGYMIGSGVVESSNKKVVTQRLKGAGMHWSERGANAIMTLRACYLSSSNSWNELWKSKVA